MSENTDSIVEQILEDIGKPQSITKGDASMSRQNIRGMAELVKVINDIERADDVSTAAAAAKPGFGLRFQKIRPYYE